MRNEEWIIEKQEVRGLRLVAESLGGKEGQSSRE